MGGMDRSTICVKCIDGIHEETIYNVDNFPYIECLTYPTVRNRHREYINIPCAFDIETTNVNDPNAPYAFMYHWQFCIDDKVIFGRTWEECILFFNRLKTNLQLSKGKILVIYIHNLSFEFQFMRSFCAFTNVFARKKRKVIKATMNGCFELRCSYVLSNMSLEKFCENSRNVIHYKNGDYDYTKYRDPFIPLTENELSYCYNDVRGLCECIADRLIDDTIATIPLTSTGYVRRDFRMAVQKNLANRKLFEKSRLTPELYLLCKEAFRGGDTHANALYADQLLYIVDSYDKSSSYPGCMMTKKYPYKFIKAKDGNVNKYIEKGYACLFRLRLEGNIYCIAEHGIPYIDIAHIRRSKNVTNDNGRVLDADALEITVTDIDWKIIEREYHFDKMYVRDLYISVYDYLPKEYREQILQYFMAKSSLKNVDGKEYEYMKSKNKLNSSFGMMVTDIAMEENGYENNDWKDPVKPNIEDALDKYYKSKKSFLIYQHGVWVTAHARAELHRGLDVLGRDCVYTDTDSGKGIGNHREGFEELNKEIIEENKNAPLPPIVVVNGKTYMTGIWEHDAKYMVFKTLGSKKYAYAKIDKGKYKVESTVAGLSKEVGRDTLTKKGIGYFRLGSVFSPSGNLTAYYNDDIEPYYIDTPNGKFITGTNVALFDSTYELGITDTYKEIIYKKHIDKKADQC